MRTETMTVASAGPEPRAATRALTWAQANMWDAVWGYGADGAALILRRVIVPDPPLPIPAALRAVTAVVARYDIARTTFLQHSRQQHINACVDIPVTFAEATEDPATDGDRLTRALSVTPFDSGAEAPVRIGLVHTGERAVAVAVAVSHLAFDSHAMSLFMEALAAELAGTGAIASAPKQTDWLLRQEAAGPIVEQSNRTLDRWQAAMAKLPSGCGIRTPAPSTYSVLSLRSAALAIAAQTTAARTRTTSSSVLLAALTRALRQTLPTAPAALQVITSNRHHAYLADFVGITLQNGLLVVPPGAPDEGFAETVQKTHRAALMAYRLARYDTRRLRDAVFQDQERGDAPDLSFFFNHVRTAASDWSGLEHKFADLPMLRDREAAEPAVIGQRSIQDATLFFHALPAGMEASLLLVCDDTLIDRDTSAKILSRMRDTILAAVLEPDAS